jgi:tRNA pseudouridine38-40 synthase
VRNLSLILAYDGTNYHGWQCQPDVVTIEETVRGAVQKILDHETKVYAGARTDSGVHALGQVVNFRTEKGIGHSNLIKGLNSLLPADIRVMGASDVDEDFHARYSARSKTYVYCILNDVLNSPFLSRYVLHWPWSLDIPAMNEALKWILGEHDFSAFKKKDEPYRNTVRELKRARFVKKGKMIYFVVEGTGFLRYMVRTIVGTAFLAGQGKISSFEFKEVLESGERERAGQTMPPQGLFLKKIRY